MKISFSTVVYEGNYEKVLLSGYLREQLKKLNYNFTKKIIYINNVDNKLELVKLITDKYPDFSFYFSTDGYYETLKKFNLTKESVTPGFLYSIAHFYNFYYSDMDYSFHLSGDCNIEHFDNKFFADSIELMERDERIIDTMPSWEILGPTLESRFEIGNFYCGKCFTDQCFMAKVSEFKKPIYNYWHDKSARYPTYGMNSFERRVDSYIQTFDKWTAIHKDYFYKHNREG